MTEKIRKFIIWFPRIFTIAFAVFLSLFALDVFSEGYGPLETLVALFMHLVPTWFVLAALVIAWKRPRVGTVIFAVLAATSIFAFDTYRSLPTLLFISGPPFIAAAGFYWAHCVGPRR